MGVVQSQEGADAILAVEYVRCTIGALKSLDDFEEVKLDITEKLILMDETSEQQNIGKINVALAGIDLRR